MTNEKMVLASCPFCGGKPEYRWHSNPECWIECSQCFAVGPNDTGTTTEQNATAWNTRAAAPQHVTSEPLRERAYQAALEEVVEATKWVDNSYARDANRIAREALSALPSRVEGLEGLREQIAQIIDPDWFGNESGQQHVLNNFPDQHLKYQAKAFAKADAIIALLGQP